MVVGLIGLIVLPFTNRFLGLGVILIGVLVEDVIIFIDLLILLVILPKDLLSLPLPATSHLRLSEVCWYMDVAMILTKDEV